VSAAAPAPAAAHPACIADLGAWTVRQGSFAPGAGRCEWLLATNAGNTRFSYGEARLVRDIPVPFDFEVTWRRLGPEQKPLELHVPGAILLVADGRYGLYVDEPSFAKDGWHDLPGFSVHARSTVRVRREKRGVILWVDGREIHRWQVLPEVDRAAHVAVGFKGAGTYRSRLWLADVTVRPLQ
jgi:hypothetical protein